MAIMSLTRDEISVYKNLTRDGIMFFVDRIEEWKDIPIAAARFRHQVEYCVFWAISLFDAISEEDTAWHTGVFEQKIDYDEAREQELMSNYESWVAGSKRLLRGIELMERQGFEVRYAAEFRERYKEACAVVASDAAPCVSDALIQLRDEAVDEHRAGRTIAFGSGDE